MSDFEARMEALRSRFRSRASDEAARLEAALASGDRSDLLRASHALVGNAGMFGFTELSQQAALIERAIDLDASEDHIVGLARTVVEALRRMNVA
jgi:HPt (histidine-containing phosphotransfer) domain-containing protein